MNTEKDPNAKEGMRIKLISMIDDPNPIPTGTLGTIVLIDDAGIIHVKWDNGRRLGVIPNVDEYVLEPDLENVFDKINEDSISKDFKSAAKKIPAEIQKSMPKMNTKPSSSVGGSLKKLNVKTNQVSSNFKKASIKNIKVESQEDEVNEITGAGGAATGAPTSSGPYVGPMGATKPTFGVGPLTSTGVAKPGPLHPKKKKKKKVKENVFTKAQLMKEVTNMQDSGIDDTNKEAWADKNSDGWKWNDKPVFNNGEIIDPLAKMDVAWDDENLDISKDWDANQKLKKEDLLRLVNNRIDESKKIVKEKWSEKYKKSIDCNNPKGFSQRAHCQGKKKVKEEEQPIEETTTFGSVFPGGNFPVVPAFAAKKGEWRTAKKPIWKGGKIVQKVENSGVLNPVNEANTVKYNKDGKFVKIKKKCTKYPYCSQGAIDNPLKISNKVTEPGSYVEEQLMKNVHEVALETGKTFDEVYKIVKKNLNN